MKYWLPIVVAALCSCAAPERTNPDRLESFPSPASDNPRARDLGVPFDGEPGEHNAITDVPGVLVGHSTVIHGDGAKAARTGVTAVLANRENQSTFAATYSHNGDGEMTGIHFINEKGRLISPVLITNTISVGSVHSAVVKWSLARDHIRPINLPVVAETWDGSLNDIYGFHVKDEHVFEALDGAATGPVAEGNVGGGTGMMAHWFKGGIGTSSRVVQTRREEFVVGVLVQANYGDRADFRVAGVPVGREINGLLPEIRRSGDGDGSIIVVVATNAPLLPHQLERVARRVSMGLARNGSFASTYSGDIFVAFSTGSEDTDTRGAVVSTTYVEDWFMDLVFRATVQATEEAIINAMVAARTMTGVNGNRVHALPHDRLREILRKHGRLEE